MIRIGMLGASSIGVTAIIQPARQIADAGVVTVAACDSDRAATYADLHNLPQYSKDYFSLISSPYVDLVYIALPPSEHAHWVMKALEQGKHVLCEKPFAMNARQAESMVSAAESSNRLLIEAFHYRYHPAFARVLEIAASGTLGNIEHISAHFDVRNPPEEGELRYQPQPCGGALLGLGCYPLHWARAVMRQEPEVLSAGATIHNSGVDIAARANLRFSEGQTASISCNMSPTVPEEGSNELIVVGSEATLSVYNPLAPQNGCNITVTGKGPHASEKFSGQSTYHYQLRHVVAAVNGTAPPLTGGADAVANMRCLDAISRIAGVSQNTTPH